MRKQKTNLHSRWSTAIAAIAVHPYRSSVGRHRNSPIGDYHLRDLSSTRIKTRKTFPRAFTRIFSSSSRRGEARRGEARRGEASGRLEKDSKGARRVHRRGLPVIIMTKARGKHPFNLLAYRQRRLRTTYHTPPTDRL